MAVTTARSPDDFVRVIQSGDNVEKIARRMRRLSRKINRRERVIGLRKGAALIVVSARQKAPKDTGRGYKQIKAIVGRDPGPGASSIGIGVHKKGFYMRFQETGYFAVGRRSRTFTTRKGAIRTTRRPISVKGIRQYSSGTTWVPPQPFLRPALHQQKKKATDIAMAYYWQKLTEGLPKIR